MFKEFLEDIIKKAFDPDLNLFKVTTHLSTHPHSGRGVRVKCAFYCRPTVRAGCIPRQLATSIPTTCPTLSSSDGSSGRPSTRYSSAGHHAPLSCITSITVTRYMHTSSACLLDVCLCLLPMYVQEPIPPSLLLAYPSPPFVFLQLPPSSLFFPSPPHPCPLPPPPPPPRVL